MKAHYRTHDNRITFEISGETPKDIFTGIASVQEVFEADSVCGCCNSTRIQFRVREWEGNDYYELMCLACYAKLSFGQNKKGGGLFAKRQDKDGNRLQHNGWQKWERKAGASKVQTAASTAEDLPF